MRRHLNVRHGLAAVHWVLFAALALLTMPAWSSAPSGGVILVVGDSLSAEYGLPRGSGWVQRLADRLQQSGGHYTVVNASISGETTSGGRTRIAALLRDHKPSVVMIQLGGNDGLRGLPVKAMSDNLAAMITASQKAGARVVLIGVQIPPNYGREYTERFAATYPALARQYKTALAPSLLEGFAESTELFQPDRIHPAVDAQPKMLDNVWPVLQPLLKKP